MCSALTRRAATKACSSESEMGRVELLKDVKSVCGL